MTLESEPIIYRLTSDHTEWYDDEHIIFQFAITSSQSTKLVSDPYTMGSYLTIVNDTSDTWMCKIGPDEAALAIAGIVAAVMAAVATTIITAGMAAPYVAVIAPGTMAVTLTAAAASVAGIAVPAGIAIGSLNLGLFIGNQVRNKMKDQGFQEIAPGGRQQHGKMSLSLWQQGTCVKTTVSESTGEVRNEKLYMRPIFSGATDNSNNDHNIQWWINKWGVETETIVAKIEG